MSVHTNLEQLSHALERFRESLNYSPDQPLVIDASIQRFEFCVELTWKTLKKALASEGVEANTPRECLQQAYVAHWLEDETLWLSMLKDRNLTSRTYKETLALEIFSHLPNYLAAMTALHELLSRKFK